MILIWVLAVFISNAPAWRQEFLNYTLPVLIILPALTGCVIAWIIYGINKLRYTNKDSSDRWANRNISVPKDAKANLPESLTGVDRIIPEQKTHADKNLLKGKTGIAIIFPSLGMVGVLTCIPYLFSGQLFMEGYYNNAGHYPVLLFISALCFVIFALAMFINALSGYHPIIFFGYLLLLIITIVSFWEFALYPRIGGIGISSQDMAHNAVVTEFIIFASLVILYLLTVGYLGKEKNRPLGFITLFAAIIMTILCVVHFLEAVNGITKYSMVVYYIFFVQLAYISCLSYYYTFRADKKDAFRTLNTFRTDFARGSREKRNIYHVNIKIALTLDLIIAMGFIVMGIGRYSIDLYRFDTLFSQISVILGIAALVFSITGQMKQESRSGFVLVCLNIFLSLCLFLSLGTSSIPW